MLYLKLKLVKFPFEWYQNQSAQAKIQNAGKLKYDLVFYAVKLLLVIQSLSSLHH